MNMPQMVRDYLDTHISQQYKQINGKKKEKRKIMKNWKEFFKWILLNPEYTRSKAGGFDRGSFGFNHGDKIDVCTGYDFVVDRDNHIPFSYDDYEANKDKGCILNWIIPEPGIGSGGHINIFRFVTRLRDMGIHNRIYLMYPGKFTSDRQCEEFLEKYYEIDCKDIEVHINISDMTYAHGVVATSWQTAYAARKFDNVISKFYFVQDFEPLFLQFFVYNCIHIIYFLKIQISASEIRFEPAFPDMLFRLRKNLCYSFYSAFCFLPYEQPSVRGSIRRVFR